MKEILQGFYKKENFARRLIIVILSVVALGFAISFLNLVNWGNDPCTTMNKGISGFIGMSFGNWQALFNIVLLILAIFLGGRNIGFGTFINMLCVGYTVDFFSWLWEKTLPLGIFDLFIVKLLVFIPAIILFVFAAALYMVMDLGTAPYDAFPFIISEHTNKVSFKVIRMIYDFAAIGIGVLFGAHFAIVSIIMALTLGPVITFLGNKLSRIK